MGESVLTKQFHHGRVETGRNLTEATAKCSELFWADGTTDDELKAAIKAALATISGTVKETAKANGIDRHLCGLKYMHKDLGKPGVPTLMQDASYSAFGDLGLSTSNCGASMVKFFGFGPPSGDGVGVGYGTSDSDKLYFCISAVHPKMAVKFSEILQHVLGQRHDLYSA